MSKADGIARYYLPEKNQQRLFFAGVPLGPISQEEYDGYADWLRESIDACPWYTKTKPAEGQHYGTSSESAASSEGEGSSKEEDVNDG